MSKSLASANAYGALETVDQIVQRRLSSKNRGLGFLSARDYVIKLREIELAEKKNHRKHLIEAGLIRPAKPIEESNA